RARSPFRAAGAERPLCLDVEQAARSRRRPRETEGSRERSGCGAGRSEGFARLDDLYPVDFHAFIALARGIADALIGLDRLNAGTPKRAGMQIDVAAAIVRHHKTKALLV